MSLRGSESTSSGLVPLSEATLGTVPRRPVAWQLTALPAELQVDVMVQLDPVSQVCLSLTCRSFHRAFHTLYGSGRPWNFGFPISLAMQTSVCEEFVLDWRYEDWYLRDNPKIVWMPSLSNLLWGDRIWGDHLYFCAGCLKYKPETAFDVFDAEREILERHRGRVSRLENIGWYWDQCRRCRVKDLLIELEGRTIVYEHEKMWEYPDIVGLIRPRYQVRVDNREPTREEIRDSRIDYESWEEIWTRLCI